MLHAKVVREGIEKVTDISNKSVEKLKKTNSEHKIKFLLYEYWYEFFKYLNFIYVYISCYKWNILNIFKHVNSNCLEKYVVLTFK